MAIPSTTKNNFYSSTENEKFFTLSKRYKVNENIEEKQRELNKVKNEKFKAKKEFNFEVFKPINEVQEVLTTTSIPKTFIINKYGDIVIDESGAIDWNSKTVRRQLDLLIAE